MGRAPCCDKAYVKRGPWSPQEDATLTSYLHTHGTPGNWIALPRKAGLRRCGKSCRLRWLNYLRPDIKHGGFTDEEDTIICTLYTQMGSRWSAIASRLPGRTDNDVKNYWNTKLKKKLMAGKVRLNTITAQSDTLPSTSLPTQVSQNQSSEFVNINHVSEFGSSSNIINQLVSLPQQGSNLSDAPSIAQDKKRVSQQRIEDEAMANQVHADFGLGFPYDIVNGLYYYPEEFAPTCYPELVDSKYAHM